MPTVDVAFSNRSQHVLRYTVTSSESGGTTTFTWSASVITSNNTRGPYGTGSFDNTAANTTYVSGTRNTVQTFPYDYRNNFNRTYNLGTGVRSAPTGSGNRNFSIDVAMGNLIGSASASITISTGSLPEPPPPLPEPSLGTITATAVSQTSINVVWSTTNNPTTVSVSGEGITTSNTASGDINATGLQPNTSYTYTLVCSNEANASNPDTVTAEARTLLPSPTMTITATTLTSTTARVVWSTTNATEASITGTNLDSTDLSGNVIVTGLTRNTIYRWSGSASNDDGTVNVQSNSITTLNVIGGVWTGSTFAVPTVRVWTGSTWAVKEAKVWTGTTWKVWV
jgi:hypothetical protein